MAAVACGLACGLSLDACAKAVAGFEPVFGRSSVHSVPDGPDYVLESQKAPLWTMANSITFMREARAPRKTMVVGTVSDYAGPDGEIATDEEAPLAEAGEGEAEGFEQADDELIDAAEGNEDDGLSPEEAQINEAIDDTANPLAGEEVEPSRSGDDPEWRTWSGRTADS